MSQDAQYDPYAGHLAQPAKKPRRWPWVLGIVAAFVVGTGVGGAGSRTPAPSYATPAPQPPAAPAQAAPAVVEAPAARSGPATSIGDCSGCEVGVDLEPGRYKTAGPDQSSIIPMCYWKRATNDSGELNAIISNQNIRGPGAVTVKNGEFIEFSGGCTWTKE
jgi:hypothetical protein